MDAAFLKEHELEVKRLTSWRWAVDASSGKHYYYDTKSKTTSWAVPKELSDAVRKVELLVSTEEVPPPPPTTEENGAAAPPTKYIRPTREGLSYCRLPSEDDFGQYARVIAEAFAIPSMDAARAWAKRLDQAGLRALKDQNQRVVCGAAEVAMGLYINGHSVPTVGVSGVGVAFDARGSGCGAMLLNEFVKEFGDPSLSAQTPIACLYPTTPQFYRKFGFEAAGALWNLKIEMSTLVQALSGLPRPADVVVRPMVKDQDMPLVEKLYVDFCVKFNGGFDRSRAGLFWTNVHNYRGQDNMGFVVEVIDPDPASPSVLEGYIFLHQSRPSPSAFGVTLSIEDIVFTTERSSLALMHFLASHRSMAEKMTMPSPPNHPWSVFIPHISPSLFSEYMVRVLHVVDALKVRHYPSYATALLCFRVHDSLLPHNNGVFLLDVRNGHAVRCENVSEYGEAPGPVLSLDVTALGCLYTGYMSAQQMALVGSVTGEATAIEAATLLFASIPGGLPWATQIF